MWATCNVGANTPEEYGDYFAWGETITKDYYVDRTYKHFVRTGSNNFKLTKYCCNIAYGSFGYIDSLMVLQSEDDAATTNWGIGWCMPTIDQWSELHQTVLGTWTSQNGVEGLLFTANNGNSLFLPAAGYWGEKYQGGWGWYWSSSLNAKDSRRAGCLTINAGDCRETSVWRVYGHSVRPVRSVSNK
ncbi:MAG: hypothetical protein J6P73_03925 [Bacteroidales bacterium]|nr:hypothetical protein [Bacteroidales bacterium]